MYEEKNNKVQLISRLGGGGGGEGERKERQVEL